MFTPNGKTEIPFEIPLKPKGNRTLYETYHGVFVNVQVLATHILLCSKYRTIGPESKAKEA